MPIVCPHCMGSFERAIGPRCPYCHRLLEEPARPAGRPGRQPAPVAPPPPNASVWQAWVAVARIPSRAMFAAWAERATTGWVALSLAVMAVVSLLEAAIVNFTLRSGILTSGATHAHTPSVAGDLARAVISALLGLAVFVLALAWVARAPQETLSQCASDLLRPIALAQVALAMVGLGLTISVALLSWLADHTPSWLAAMTLLALLLLGVAALVYGLSVTISSAQAGSGLGGWRVFGVYILCAIATTVALGLALHALGAGGSGVVGAPFLGALP